MRISEANGRKVVSTSTAATVGKVQDFVIDAPAGKVVALLLKKTEGDADTLLWPAIASFGADAVTVPDASAVTTADGRVKALQDKRYGLHGKRVLSKTGEDLGVVKDIDFDPADGTVRALLTSQQELPGSRLVDVGSYAVIVEA